MGMTMNSLSGRCDEHRVSTWAARRVARSPIRLRRAARVRSPPLPPTLVLEGATQPFLFEMVASQALHARRPRDPVIAGQSTTHAAR
jgi:hypothetical protein